MSIPAQQSAASGGPALLTVVETSPPSADRAGRAPTARAAVLSALVPFAVEVQRREHVTTVRPRGELDLTTAETLRGALDAAISESPRAARLVLDLRGLSFMDSTGLHLLVALNKRAQRDGFQLTLIAPAAPTARAIRLSGLDQTLPFAAPVDAVDAGAITSPLM